MRNLTAFRVFRKVAAAALLAIGGAGWGALVWVASKPEPPAPQLERAGIGLRPLWDASCQPAVASSRGARYYWAWCEGAGRLKPGNLRHFCAAAEAEMAGLTLAKGCGGGQIPDAAALVSKVEKKPYFSWA